MTTAHVHHRVYHDPYHHGHDHHYDRGYYDQSDYGHHAVYVEPSTHRSNVVVTPAVTVTHTVYAQRHSY